MSRRGERLSALIYRDLREEIVSLVRTPGEPLIEMQVAKAHGVSRTPAREAIQRLADEGLIDIFPQSGTFIARIPAAELPEAIAIRCALEEATVRVAALRISEADLAALRAQLALQAAREAAGDKEGFHRADEAFHAMLAAIAGQPRFWTVAQQVKTQVDRFRRLTLPVAGRMGSVVAEHAVIVDRLASRDQDAAAAAIGAHLGTLLGIIEAARLAQPEMFS
ncbi:GntR family transcriptional regulator [Lichenicoccus sp.]|uniref:GntR family transcriptional regulator n=1 Tax=Lichenicoccus sp. TaxID=2781899 RepID=UPI003D0A322E